MIGGLSVVLSSIQKNLVSRVAAGRRRPVACLQPSRWGWRMQVKTQMKRVGKGLAKVATGQRLPDTPAISPVRTVPQRLAVLWEKSLLQPLLTLLAVLLVASGVYMVRIVALALIDASCGLFIVLGL